ncbi:alpha/beta hydrolase [Algoriphagus formosus]|uniref:Phospholipase n=1 Tax=Algoriphagus formosus TaxID=2007308 RepID=A0A4V3AR06_9BACT|nr:dienelactone hydrolase family protein [Algoriphagus aquimaris]TDK44777.1 phospholipase [Algoriphagus aquimaris]
MNKLINEGQKPQKGKKAAIMIHGRGASAESILSLKSYLKLDDFALIAPQAAGGTWYPYSFMAPDQSNQPALTNSLQQIKEAFGSLIEGGVLASDIYLIGFSQGACLSLEFASRNAQKLGGVVAFTGGLIGEKINRDNYQGDFEGTPVLISGSQQDMHVPLERMQESETLLTKHGAKVKLMTFADSAHTIRQEEIDWVNQHILG